MPAISPVNAGLCATARVFIPDVERHSGVAHPHPLPDAEPSDRFYAGRRRAWVRVRCGMEGNTEARGFCA